MGLLSLALEKLRAKKQCWLSDEMEGKSVLVLEMPDGGHFLIAPADVGPVWDWFRVNREGWPVDLGASLASPDACKAAIRERYGVG